MQTQGINLPIMGACNGFQALLKEITNLTLNLKFVDDENKS